MDWFYNKKITLLEEKDGYLYHGSWVDGELVEIKMIPCDVQPASREQIFKDYGYYIDCSYRIFCNTDGAIDVGNMIRYNGNDFNIVKIIKWDDYYDVFIQEIGKATEVIANE